MRKNKPTVAVTLDNRREKSDGTFPLRLRITYQRERKYYKLDLADLTNEDWEKIQKSERLRDERLKELRVKIQQYEVTAQNVFDSLPSFNFTAFEEAYFSDHQNKDKATDVYYAFEEQIARIKAQGRISTASSYETACNSLKGYKSRLRFNEITPAFLEGYEAYLLSKGKSVTTVGIYLRNLRTLINQAMAKNLIAAAQYPFGKNKYEIPAGRNLKKALTLAEIERIYLYQTVPGTIEDRAKDMWFFSYLCNGINVKDICRLRYKDIDGDRVTFIRAKTARTKKRNAKPIVVFLSDIAQSIINKWGNPHKHLENYVFPILPGDVSPQRERELVQYLTRSINKYVKRIASELGIEKPVTTYTARHSFSTVLKRSGAPIEFISESLGHHDLKTTESYLDSFEDSVKREYANVLLNFNQNK